MNNPDNFCILLEKNAVFLQQHEKSALKTTKAVKSFGKYQNKLWCNYTLQSADTAISDIRKS